MVLPRSHASFSPKSIAKANQWFIPAAFFLLGCFVGRTWDLFFGPGGTSYEWRYLPFIPPSSNRTNKTSTISSSVEGGHGELGDGWNSIQVFYGDTKPFEEELGSHRRWFSQASQDQLVLELLKFKRNGFFVDLAANDATSLSNTYALERFYDWEGLCIEPNPRYWYNLTHLRRKCRIVAAVVGERHMEQVHFRYSAGDHGGIAGEGFDNGKRWQQSSSRAYTTTLLEIFERNQVPSEIDYLSLDVEGAESFIMMQFPLHRYRIKIITAERLRGEVRSYLKKHDYEFVQRLTRWGESLWVHKSVRNSLDMSVLEKFQFPIDQEV